MIFYKTVSGGNDFLHLEIDETADRSGLVRDICHRHTGAGADGVIFYRAKDKNGSPQRPIDFEIVNRDGSPAEISGNGMAGLASLMFFLGVPGPEAGQITLSTVAGLRTHRLLDRRDNHFRLNIEIGPPDFSDLRFFPFLEEGVDSYSYEELTFFPVSVGNPHAVIVWQEEWEPDRIASVAEKLATADIFPLGVNVEILMKEGAECCVYFYERGVGPTQTSSTGSAAIFAVLRRQGLVNDSLSLPGGIKISGKSAIFIENSTEIVYKGIYKKTFKQNHQLQPEYS